MTQKVRAILFCLLMIMLAISIGSDVIAEEAKNCTGVWSSGSVTPYDSFKDKPVDIRSPNGKYSIRADKESLTLIGEKGSFKLDVYLPLVEVLWSPDSKGFVVNASDGGLVGTWEARYYSISQDGSPVLNNTKGLLHTMIDNFAKCETKEDVNVGGVAWLDNGKELLLVAEVPPHSSCKNMGDLMGFRVNVKSRHVLERMTGPAVKKKWEQYLGCRIRQ